ncbi:glycosyltransferase involved in cell wall biosynthesis [Nakamurella sp. UYEF19]|uniref:glycosyltransferase n=1 Tax=Nakamurella sp. UYEF19 TaxID=1756392 RepID=UPI0033944180
MSQRPIRVLQVVQRFYPELGGLETHVAEVTSRLRDMPDIEITVLTTDRTGDLPAEDEINGVRVIRRRSWPREKDYYFSPGLVKVIRNGGWDVVHLQGGQTFVPLVGMLAALSARIPYVLTFHTGGYSTAGRSVMGWIRTRALAPLLSRSAKLVAVSRFEKRSFSADTGIDPAHFTVINNGGALPPVPAGVLPQPGSIVSSGRLEKYKGHHRAIEALPIIRRTVPDARLTILGGGPYEGELRTLAASLGVTDHVTIKHLPPTERAQMASVLAGSSVMAALSSYEAHPVGIMEALALGLPVLGCDVAGIGDLVEDGLVRGIDVAAGPDEIAAALVEMLAANSDGKPRRAADFELPTWEGCAAALADVYREVTPAVFDPPVVDPQGGTQPPLRIAQIITTLTTGGAEKQLESLVAHSSNAHRTIALYEGGTIADSMVRAGAKVDVLGMGGLRKLVAIPRLALRLRRMRPDVVHVHLLSAQLWGIPAARLAGVRTIVSSEHSLMETSMEMRPLTPTLHLIYRALESMVTRTIAVSATTKTRLLRWGVDADRITVVDNGIDFDALAFDDADRRARRAEFGLGPDAILIGAVGRLDPVKRFPQLLEALAPTLERGARELVLVGDGSLRDGLASRATELGVGDCVHLTGPRGDVPALLAAMDVMVSPCRDETFGMAVLEGLGSGLPVVYAECPALDELAERPDWAIQLAPADGAEVAEAESIRLSIEQCLSLRGRDRFPLPAFISDAYGIGRAAAASDQLYRDLIADQDFRPAQRTHVTPASEEAHGGTAGSATSLVLASRGDALTPYLFRALAKRFGVAGQLAVDLTKIQRYVTALTTFRPSRTAWVEKFYKSSRAYRYRSANAARGLAAVSGPFDLVFQIHALFDIPETASTLYIDCTHRQSADHWPAWNPLAGRELEEWYRRERTEYLRAEHLFAFCEPTRRSLIDDYGVPEHKVTTTYAGVNLDELPELTGRADVPTILFIGNDFVRKGGEDLLRAFALVRKVIPDAVLQLVGTDPRIQAQDGVEVLGRINDRSRVEQLYRQASVFTVTSYFDPFPLVLLEAMAFGLPTVSSHSCGIPEIVEDGITGTLVEAGDVDALAAALIATLSDPESARAAGRAGRARVERLFTWDAVVERMAPALEGIDRQLTT